MPSRETIHLFKRTSPDEQDYCLTFMEDYMRTADKDSEEIKLLAVYHHELLLFYQFCKIVKMNAFVFDQIVPAAPMYDNIEEASDAIDYWNDMINTWDP